MTSTGWPQLGDEEITAAERVLRSGKLNYWTGEEGKLFEREYADYVGQPHAIAVANGTAALELALHALGIGPGDEVIVPSRTFIATASAAVARGAIPICADVDAGSQNITAETIAAQITPRTRAVIPVHLAGWPCDMPAILELAKQHGLAVIEDCSQAHGATLDKQPVGSFGDAATFSFCQDKILTTAGEGGMLLLNDEATYRRAWSYRDHGKDFDAVHSDSVGSRFRWLHHSFGTNWRMSEVQSAIGRVVLQKLDGWVATRRKNAATLDRLLGECSQLRVPKAPSNVGHAYYKWYAFLRPELLASDWDRDRLLVETGHRGGVVHSGSCGEIYRERAFESIHPQSLRFPNARELGETSLLLLVDPAQDEPSLESSATALKQAIGAATRATTVAA